MFGENLNHTKLYEERKLASRILQALTYTDLTDELKYYKPVIQNDLHLTDEQMASVFSFSKLAELMTPDEPRVRRYKGVSVETYQNVVLDCNHAEVLPKTEFVELQQDLAIELGREPTKDEMAVAVAFTNDLENERHDCPETNKVLQKLVEEENKKETEVVVEKVPEKLPEESEESSEDTEPEKKEPVQAEVEPEEDTSSEEETDPVDILRQKLKSKGLNNLTFNDKKNPGFIIVTGKVNLKKGEHDKIRSLGGVWTASESGFMFSVKKLLASA